MMLPLKRKKRLSKVIFDVVIVCLSSKFFNLNAKAFAPPKTTVHYVRTLSTHSRLIGRFGSPSDKTDYLERTRNETLSLFTRSSSNSPKDHHHNENKYQKAIHQAEHRATEKAAFGIAERLSEQVAKSSEAAVELIGERALENVGERVLEQSAEKVVKQTAGKSAERVTEQLTERLGERATDRLVVEKSARRCIEQAGAKVTAGRTTEAGERLVEQAGKSMGSKSVEIGERALERTGEKVLKEAGVQSGETAVATLIERGSERSVARFTKGLMIALPAIGGLFALYLLKSDIQRMKEEWAERMKPSFSLYVGAGLADLVDTILHFFIFFGLWTGLSHHKLVVAEELSMACAIASTACAVIAEVVSYRIRARRRSKMAL